MAIIKNPTTVITGGGSAEVVNGIIEQYKASTGTIDANTFVEFVNNLTPGTDVRLSTRTYGGNKISATALDDTTVFVAHSGNAQSASSTYVYGIVCTISGTTITAGTEYQVDIGGTYGGKISVAKLSSTAVFVATSGQGALNNANSRIVGIVCTISGTIITSGTYKVLSTTTYGAGGNIGEGISVTALSSAKVFVAHGGGSNASPSLYGIVCTISGTTITAGTDTLLTTQGIRISVTALSSAKVFVAHNKNTGDNGRLYGIVCTISGTTITAGTDIKISTTPYSSESMSVVSLTSTKVFVAHNGYSNSGTTSATVVGSRAYGIVCTISGTTITAGTDTLLTATPYSGSVSAVTLDDTSVFVTYNGGDDNTSSNPATADTRVRGNICTINGTTITTGDETILSDTTYGGMVTAPVFLPDSSMVFIAHTGDATVPNEASRVYGIVVGAETLIKSSTSRVNGLTKTECSTSAAGQVWVLNN